MIKSLIYTVTFPISGATLSGNYQPESGITAVVGPNEVGKSFGFIEIPRFLLYGKAALRGMAGDYKTLDATGVFVIKGKTYTITRSAKKEQITDENGIVLAVNAEAVTKKVIELMGYGLSVFDIANASVQKQADLFGKMRAAERKRMIDQVAGVASNEVVEKSCRDEAKAFKREVEALSKNLQAPVLRDKPKGYEDSKTLGRRLAEGRALRMTESQLRQKLSTTAAPIPPKLPAPLPQEVYEVEGAERYRSEVEASRRALQPLTEAPTPEWTLEDLDNAELRLRYREELARREKDHKATCPNCHHEFPLVEREPLPENPEGPDLTKAEILDARFLHNRLEQVKEARAKLAALPTLPDQSQRLEDLHARQAEDRAYREQLNYFTQVEEQNARTTEALAQLGKIPKQEELDVLADLLSECRMYEMSVSTYHEAKALYEQTMIDIVEKQRLAEEFKKGGDALLDARATLKAHLAPALSLVASKLLRDMTHGKRQSIFVDQDMEISVDGQRIETLSGGAETVVNIALRIALGQVLVSQTFPVFLGDEMDADTDSVRREAVIEAMVALKKHLSQIILVTHRDVSVADQVVDLSITV